jgi:carbon monoxide dehydrogenase subunit G
MPQREASFAVNAPPEALWRFLRDLPSLCACIPGVQRLEVIDERHAALTVQEKVGVVPMIVDLSARIESEDPPRQLHAVAVAEHLTMEIDVALEARGGGTQLMTAFKVTGTGPLKAVVDRLFERRATERAEQFAKSLEARFGEAARAAAEPAAAAPAQPVGALARAWRWLSALVRRLLARARR